VNSPKFKLEAAFFAKISEKVFLNTVSEPNFMISSKILLSLVSEIPMTPLQPILEVPARVFKKERFMNIAHMRVNVWFIHCQFSIQVPILPL